MAKEGMTLRPLYSGRAARNALRQVVTLRAAPVSAYTKRAMQPPLTPAPLRTLAEAAEKYLDDVSRNKAPATHVAYKKAIDRFRKVIQKDAVPARDADPLWLAEFADSLAGTARATQSLWVTAVVGFYNYISHFDQAAFRWADVEHIAKTHKPAAAKQVIRRYRPDIIHKLLARAEQRVAEPLPPAPRAAKNESPEKREQRVRLGRLRDRALLLTLADTGLRVSEACSLNRGHVDWNEEMVLVIAKGGDQHAVHISTRAIKALKHYLAERSQTLDGPIAAREGRRLDDLPLFARHDRMSRNRLARLSTNGVRQMLNELAAETGSEHVTPHMFRHYFITTILRGTGGDLKQTQEIARHKSIVTTQRYAHVTDEQKGKTYHEIINRRRRREEDGFEPAE